MTEAIKCDRCGTFADMPLQESGERLQSRRVPVENFQILYTFIRTPTEEEQKRQFVEDIAHPFRSGPSPTAPIIMDLCEPCWDELTQDFAIGIRKAMN